MNQMSYKKDFKYDNDPDNVIADTVKLLLKSTEMMSDKLPDDLLQNLYSITNFRDALPDIEITANLLFTVYSSYKTLKGIDEWDLDEHEFNRILVSWNILLGIERLRRNKMISVKPFKILDFDTMENTKMKLEIDKTLLQSLMN